MRFIRKDAHERKTGQRRRGERRGARKGIGSSKIRVSLSENSGSEISIYEWILIDFRRTGCNFSGCVSRHLPGPSPSFFFLSLSFVGHAGSRVRVESWNECRHRCMHRYSYLNCNLHSREDARETSRGRGKGKILVLEGILSGGKAVSFVVDWWRRVERLNVNVGSTNYTGKTLQSFSFFSRLSGIDWIFVIPACE